VRGENELGDPCWIAADWAPTPGVTPPGVEIKFCPFCGFDFRKSGLAITEDEVRQVGERLSASLAPLIVHLLPEEWAIKELVKQSLLRPERLPVLRIVIQQGSPPVISDTYITFREGSERQLREKRR